MGILSSHWNPKILVDAVLAVLRKIFADSYELFVSDIR